MTNASPVNFGTDKRVARRYLFDTATDEELAPVLDELRLQRDETARQHRERDLASVAAALKLPAQGWPELAAWVDEGTWLRILGEMPPDQRADLEAIRPPAGVAPRPPAA